MNVRYVCKWCLVSTLLALGSSFGLNKPLFAQPAPTDVEEGVEVLTRGPVHEAFAETVTFDPEPGIVTPKAPPAAIEEVPPEQRLEGDNVAWIPGYWAWDDERNDYLWVSGVWRNLPPGRQWVPGYWGESEQGFQWISGYWSDAQVSEVEYLPEPPATIEVGPNIAAPSADDIWQPGCWVWQNSRYAWRPGFWATAQQDWVWTPARYVWAPRGYVFVDGYWDYSIGRRGVLFAPVYFNAGVYGRQGFSYSPTTVIDLGVFSNHLFLRPRYNHYYFGDYYARDYRGAGFYPSYSYNSRRYGYDPIYAHQRWQHRQDRGWEDRQQVDFRNRRDHENVRPPRTWAAQRALGTNEAISKEGSLMVAKPLDDFRRDKNSPMRFRAMEQSERRQFSQRAQEVQQFRAERQKLETNAMGKPAETRTRQAAPARVKIPGSPLVAKPIAELGGQHAPPKTYDSPKLDPKVEPKARMTRSLEQPRQHTVRRVPTDTKQPPSAERRVPQPQTQQKAERRVPQPQTQQKAERRAPQPQTQQKAERRAPQPQTQQKAERRAPQPQTQQKAERRDPQPQTQQKAERTPRQPRDGGGEQNKSKGKTRNKD